MNDVILPEGYIRLSYAVSRLANGMWGGIRRPVPVQEFKQTFKKASIGFGPWREHVGQRFTAAVVQGDLAVYVVPKSRGPSAVPTETPRSVETITPILVPVNVLKRLITRRGSLSDRPIRLSIKTTDRNEKLFLLLRDGLLVVRASDFNTWYRSDLAKGKWPSQRERSKISNGRPTKQTEAIRNAVLALTRRGAWSRKAGIPKLRRLLVASDRSDIPSVDTLERVVEQLHRETGEPELRRKPRARGRLKKRPFPQNPV
jgi:hypothetical protein